MSEECSASLPLSHWACIWAPHLLRVAFHLSVREDWYNSCSSKGWSFPLSWHPYRSLLFFFPLKFYSKFNFSGTPLLSCAKDAKPHFPHGKPNPTTTLRYLFFSHYTYDLRLVTSFWKQATRKISTSNELGVFLWKTKEKRAGVGQLQGRSDWQVWEKREGERRLSKSFRLKWISEKFLTSPNRELKSKDSLSEEFCDGFKWLHSIPPPCPHQLPGHWLELSIQGSMVEADSKGTVSGSCRLTALSAVDFLLKGDPRGIHPRSPQLLTICCVSIKVVPVFSHSHPIGTQKYLLHKYMSEYIKWIQETPLYFYFIFRHFLIPCRIRHTIQWCTASWLI